MFQNATSGAPPTLSLGGMAPDTPAGGAIVSIIPNVGIEVDSSANAFAATCVGGTGGAGQSMQSQFYVTGAPATLRARTFQTQPGVQSFAGLCVVVPLTGIQVTDASGAVINLNPGDGNAQFPESRRCIVFNTAN